MVRTLLDASDIEDELLAMEMDSEWDEILESMDVESGAIVSLSQTSKISSCHCRTSLFPKIDVQGQARMQIWIAHT